MVSIDQVMAALYDIGTDQGIFGDARVKALALMLEYMSPARWRAYAELFEDDEPNPFDF